MYGFDRHWPEGPRKLDSFLSSGFADIQQFLAQTHLRGTSRYLVENVSIFRWRLAMIGTDIAQVANSDPITAFCRQRF